MIVRVVQESDSAIFSQLISRPAPIRISVQECTQVRSQLSELQRAHEDLVISMAKVLTHFTRRAYCMMLELGG